MVRATRQSYIIDAEPGSLVKQSQPRKRRRVVISCTECHRRKQKCDRDLPCANCKSRNKESACVYETAEAPAASRRKDDTGPASRDGHEPLSSIMAAAWGYPQTGVSTMNLMQKIERVSIEGDEVDSPRYGQAPGLQQDSAAMKEKYKTLIRRLPAKPYLEKLIEMFLSFINHQYWFVDPDILYRQLEEWNALSFKTISTLGPQYLPPDLRVFPAVLFQIAGIVLLGMPTESCSIYKDLRHAGNGSLADLACSYSESGMEVVNLLGKRILSLTTVQAEFLRASFLKYSANVVESWHIFSATVRDAQELGMHRDSLDPKPPADASSETVLEYQWLVQRRRKMFMVLITWDVYMSVMLGRPGVIDWKYGKPTLPVDAPHPSSRSRSSVVFRDPETEPPTPLSKCLWVHRVLEGFYDIKDMEQYGAYPKEWSKVERIHQNMLDVEEGKPAFLRLENPDIRWDHLPGMQWLQDARHQCATLHHFGLMALHRPYIFHREKSRVEGLRAGLRMVELQSQCFMNLSVDSQTNFHLFYGTFDAIVLIASIYILFPREHLGYRDTALQQLHWVVERFSAMQEGSHLARSALGVIKAITGKMARVMANTAASGTRTEQTYSQPMGSAASASLTDGITESTPTSGGLEDVDENTMESVGAEGARMLEPQAEVSFTFTTGMIDEAGMDSMHKLSGLAPVYPVGDLIFNDLSAMPACGEGAQTSMYMPSSSLDWCQRQQQQPPPPLPPPLDGGGGGDEGIGIGMPWQFEGVFGEDTFWEFLNQYQPAVGPA